MLQGKSLTDAYSNEYERVTMNEVSVVSRLLNVSPKIPVFWLFNQTLISVLLGKDFVDGIKVTNQLSLT